MSPTHAANGLLQELIDDWGVNARVRFWSEATLSKGAIVGEAGLRAEPLASGANGSELRENAQAVWSAAT